MSIFFFFLFYPFFLPLSFFFVFFYQFFFKCFFLFSFFQTKLMILFITFLLVFSPFSSTGGSTFYFSPVSIFTFDSTFSSSSFSPLFSRFLTSSSPTTIFKLILVFFLVVLIKVLEWLFIIQVMYTLLALILLLIFLLNMSFNLFLVEGILMLFFLNSILLVP